MNDRTEVGIDRQGLDESFAAEETRKSALLLEARLLSAQQQPDAAAAKFAEAAELEEHLAQWCLARRKNDKALVHLVSAVGSWARAGNFFKAIVLSDDLLGRPDVGEHLRQQVQAYAGTLRLRRSQWYAGLPPAPVGVEG
jgi:hypothetical protein